MARVTVVMNPEEKRELEARAAHAGTSAGEFVRRAVAAYDADAEREAVELRALIDAFNTMHRTTLRRLADNERVIAANLAALRPA